MTFDDGFFNAFTADTNGDGTSPNHNKAIHKTFDCSIMDIADDISNAIHDLEDVIYLKLIDKQDFTKKLKKELENHISTFDSALTGRSNKTLKALLNNLFNWKKNKQAIGDLVYVCVNACEIYEITELSRYDNIFRYNVKLKQPYYAMVEFLKKYVLENIIKFPNVQTIVHGGMMVIMRLFDAYESNPEALLSPEWYDKYKKAEARDKKRIICNFIAGMTDAYAYRIYSRHYGYNNSNMFEKI